MNHKILPQIKALPSFYAGVKFRSRLEARWARYFDMIGVKWQYEPEGYELPSGNYCPDFFCSGRMETGFFVEVKPDDIGRKMVQQKLLDLCQMTDRIVVCVVGNPSLKEHWCCSKPYNEEFAKEWCEVSFSQEGMLKHGLYWGSSEWSDESYSDEASKMRFENGVAVV